MLMTIFRNFRNQSAFYDHISYHVSQTDTKQLIYSLERSALKQSQRTRACIKV